MIDFMFTDVSGLAASAASEKRRITSVSQSTLDFSLTSVVKLALHASTIPQLAIYGCPMACIVPSATKSNRCKQLRNDAELNNLAFCFRKTIDNPEGFNSVIAPSFVRFL